MSDDMRNIYIEALCQIRIFSIRSLFQHTLKSLKEGRSPFETVSLISFRGFINSGQKLTRHLRKQLASHKVHLYSESASTGQAI